MVMAPSTGSVGGPAGTMHSTFSSGRKAPSRTVSWLSVARMPCASHVSTTVTPGVSRATNPWTIMGCDGSLVSMAWRPRRSHTGPSEPNSLRPWSRQPPGTRSARVVDSAMGMSLPISACPDAEDLAVGRPTEDALAERVAEGVEGRGQADPVVVHARRQRGCRRVAGEAPLFCGERRQVEAETAEPLGRGRRQPPDAAKVGEIVVREATGFVEAGGTVTERLERRFVEHG